MSDAMGDAMSDTNDQLLVSADQQPLQQLRNSLFVRRLPSTADSERLREFFSQYFPVRHATVVVDKVTKETRGFAFVTFADAADAKDALKTFDGLEFDGSKLKVEPATPRARRSDPQKSPSVVVREARHAKDGIVPKVIVRNLPWKMNTDERIRRLFMSYGKIKHINMPKRAAGLSPGYAFVVYRSRHSAARAIDALNGRQVEGREIAVDWAVDKTVWEANITGADNETEILSSKSESEEEADIIDVGDAIKDEATTTPGVEETEMEMEQRGPVGNPRALHAIDANANDHKISDRGSDQNTIFVRNLPFSVTDEALHDHFSSFGAIKYAKIVIDSSTQRPRGTGFVRFQKRSDCIACIRNAPTATSPPNVEHRPMREPSKVSMHSILEDHNLDPSGQYTLEGRVLQISEAVERQEAERLASINIISREGKDRDRRRLYLLAEGNIRPDDSVRKVLSDTEIKMREDSIRQRQLLVKSNPSLHLSLTRLSIRNIPQGLTSKDLKSLARQAVVGFASDVKLGTRKSLSKEELCRGGIASIQAEKLRRAKGKGVVKQAKIMFESKEGGLVSTADGPGRSRGYGFIEYTSHRWALMGLRWLNGHATGSTHLSADLQKPNASGPKGSRRLVAEFAIENAEVVLRRQQREEKARERSNEVSLRRQNAGVSEKPKLLTKGQMHAKSRKVFRERPDHANIDSARTLNMKRTPMHTSPDGHSNHPIVSTIGRQKTRRRVKRSRQAVT